MQDERRRDYIDLGSKVDALGREMASMNANLAIANTNLENVIKMFHDHLADDKRTVERVNGIDTSIARIYGFSAASGFICSMVFKWLGEK